MKIAFFFVVLLSCCQLHSQGKFFGGSGDGFATITISNVVLPVEIVHFSVGRNGTVMQGEVTIHSTESICGLQLERSGAGGNYVAVDSMSGWVQGGRFVFTDRAPMPGDNYYRVRISRCDGEFVLSKILLLRTAASDQFIISTSGIRYTIVKKGILEIIGGSGQVVYRQMINAGTGQLAIRSSMAGGLYFLRFDGQPTGKFLIQ